jgi:hypothetical protein
MERPPRAALVALLVVLAGVAVVANGGATARDDPTRTAPLAVEAGSGVANGSNGTVERLPVGDGPVVSGTATVDGDLGAAVSIGDRELRSRMLGYATVERLADAANATENRTVIRDALDEAQARIEALRDAERDAVEAYRAREIDIGELFRRLGRIDAVAGSLERSVSQIRAASQGVDGFSYQLRTRSLWVRQELGTFQIDTRDRLNRSLRGTVGATRVRVVAGADGFVLETVEDGTYVRDAVRFDNYEPNEAPTVGGDDVVQLTYERYPSLGLAPDSPSGGGSLSVDPPIGQRLWRLALRYPQGSSTVYFDQSTGEVYREVHRLELDDLPTHTVARTTGRDVAVVVNATDGDNPYRVTVVDELTGEPVDAAVTVDGTAVGTTGADGTLWTLGPRGGFTVGVEADGDAVEVAVDPAA